MTELLNFVGQMLPNMLRGAGLTLQLSLVALLIGLVVGLPLGLARTYGGRWLRRLVGAYVTLFRGTPLLIQLFLVYYGLPDLGIVFSRFGAAVVTLGLNSAAYQAEYFRGALQAVGAGQLLAARAIGMSQLKAIRYIVLPQAVRIALPAWSNEIIAMIKYTAVVYLIAVQELMGQAKLLSSRYFDPIPIYLLVALVYLVLIGAISLLLRQLERRIEIPGLQLETERR